MEEEFDQQFSRFQSNQKRNLILSSEKYAEIVTVLQQFRNEDFKPSKETQKLVVRFSLHCEMNKEMLYIYGTKGDSEKPKKVVKTDELFGLLTTTLVNDNSNQRLGHAGRDIMWHGLRDYHGISKEVIEIFVKLCPECELKKGIPKKGIVVKPIVTKDFNERCQVDLIDLQSVPDGEFKFLMVYQDHFTKFVVLRALQRKTKFEVVDHLMEIFGTFGAPKILQSDNGKEFANRLVKELVSRWPSCRIVHGRPRHSQSQGSVERANQDVERILCTQLREQQSTRWARILPIVQLMKNQRYHRGIGRSPYEAIFGRRMQLGFVDTIAPSNAERNIEDNEQDVFDQEDEKIIDWSESIRGAITENPTFFPDTDEEEDAIAKEKEGDFLQRDEEISHHRNGAALQQQKQAEKMLEKSKNRFGAVEVGQTVRLPIDAVDRPKIGHSTLFGVVMEENEGFYQIGTANGILQQKLTRNQFEPANNNFLSIKEVPQVESTFRSAVGSQSLTGTQGHKHCNCMNGCVNGRCACRKANLQCNSRCHKSNTCKNK